ncbi:PAS domain-containing sensor histidine kinase [Halobacteriales archaeon Cl-PHB]
MVSATVALIGVGVGLLAGGLAGYLGGQRAADPTGGPAADSEQRYRALAENFPEGSVALFDTDLTYEVVAGQLFDRIDVDADHFEGEAIEDAHSDTYADRFRDHYQAVLDGEEATFEFRHGDRTFESHLVPVTDEDGTVVKGLDITRDVTELRERERALKESERRYRTLAEYFPRGVVSLFDEDLRYTLTAGGVFEYIDLEAADFEGHTIDEAHAPGYVDRHREQFEACLDGESSTFEFSHAGRVYRTRLVPVTDDDGGVVSGMSLTTDITDLKERERQLERQNERLDEFASLLSHDLRNPLQVAEGRLAIAATDVDSEDVERARTALGRMDDLIDDVLTMAKEGQSADTVEVHLETAARQAWDAVETTDASLRIDGDRVFQADEQGLARVFENLFRNALEHGGADVTVTVGPTDDGFFVADDGPGIPEADREAVLEKGYSTADGGTGFGLAIVAEVAEAHGWDVSVDESVDGGAQFGFSFADETVESDGVEA